MRLASLKEVNVEMRECLRIFPSLVVTLTLVFSSQISPLFSDEIKVSPRTDEEIEDVHEKLFIMQGQALRDLKKGKDLREKAIAKITTAEEILAEIRKDPEHPEYQKIVDEANQSLEIGRNVLTVADGVIRWAQRRSDHIDQVLKRIPKTKNKRPEERHVLGTTLPLFHKGDVKIARRGEKNPDVFDFQTDILLPGDTVETGKDGRLGVGSMFARGHVITLGPESKMELHTDTNKENLWHLYEGAIHVASAKGSVKIEDAVNPRIETPEKIIDASDDAEFDVYVDPAGRTRVEVYKGEVKQTVKKPHPIFESFQEEQEKKHPLPQKWWEQI